MAARRRRPFGPLAISVGVHGALAVVLIALPAGVGSHRVAVDLDVIEERRPPPPLPPPPAQPAPVHQNAPRGTRPPAAPIATPAPPTATPPPAVEPPPMFEMSNDSFATGPSSWSLPESHGTSSVGAYGQGDPTKRGLAPAVPGPPSFAPASPDVVRSPPEVAEEVQAEYPEPARRAGVTGVVRLLVEVRRDGSVRSVRALNDPGYGLADAAERAMRRFRFTPAIDLGGNSVDYRLTYSYRFELGS